MHEVLTERFNLVGNLVLNAQRLIFVRGEVTFNVHLANREEDIAGLVATINNWSRTNKDHIYVFGFPGIFQEENLPTISQARTGASSIYLQMFIGVRFRNNLTFFHDAATPAGMSGGPISYVDIANRQIHVFGIAKSVASSIDPTNPGAVARCSGTFLRDF